MRATPCQFHSLRVCFAGALTEGWVIHLVIDFVDILRQACSEAFQGPNCEPLWVYLLGHVPGRFLAVGGASPLSSCQTDAPRQTRNAVGVADDRVSSPNTGSATTQSTHCQTQNPDLPPVPGEVARSAERRAERPSWRNDSLGGQRSRSKPGLVDCRHRS